MNGVYTNRFSKTENTAPNRPPITMPDHGLSPAESLA